MTTQVGFILSSAPRKRISFSGLFMTAEFLRAPQDSLRGVLFSKGVYLVIDLPDERLTAVNVRQNREYYGPEYRT